MRRLVPALLLAAAAAASPYGAEPWVAWWGTPAARADQTVVSARGTARFTILTPRLVRLERTPAPGAFEDARSWVVWNRGALPVVNFSARTVGNVTTIDTGALTLVYADDGAPFSDASLRVTRSGAAFWPNASATWTPSATPFNDGGQLFGTFHTLDSGHEGYEAGGLNCSLLDPNDFDPQSTADYVPCDFGLLSKSGFALVDDSRTPVWDEAAGWPRARAGGSACAAPGAPAAPCFPPAFDTADAAMCAAVGCCVDAAPAPLGLWYSARRDDHFTDNLNCSACAGLDYVFQHAQGAVWPAAGPGRVALNLYWNAGPLEGAGGDNVASSFAPAQPGYVLSRVEGYVGDPALPQPPATVALKLFYSAAHLDHWTTSSAADEAAAAAAGYAFVGLVGYAAAAAGPAAPFKCAAPDAGASRTDWYLFAHVR
jgi:hypothetical protein